MVRVAIATSLVLALAPAGASAATCAGPNPAITSVMVKSVTSSGSLDVYHISGTVTNLGSAAQPKNVLQFVDIYADADKHDSRGIPPLAPGQSYTFGYDWQRSADAGKGTTTLQFRMDMSQGDDCNPANGSKSLTF